MKSITYWSRLEPRPRGREVLESLQARVRDPLWFLTRQFQMGEFQGEDAAAPAYMQVAYRTSPFSAWSREAPRPKRWIVNPARGAFANGIVFSESCVAGRALVS